ncbi:MAG: hypothetical protein M3437_01035 [Chloroflexota bacterium]|nr:hypothetical protein [Chloroflexota bacterium]MDQ5866344.1 hypothetical protein [Chloroflexota bacterium]
MFAYGRHTHTWRSRSFHFAIPLNPFRPRRWLAIELIKMSADKRTREASAEVSLKLDARRHKSVEMRQQLEDHILRQVTRRYM